MFLLIEGEEELRALAARAARAPAIALDVEANGLFAYRARVCTAQLAFSEGGAPVVAIVDALRAPVPALAPLLGPEGPPKILHDLTFDARLLVEAGAPLARVRDTSVAARFLGAKATGLAALLERELGVQLDKALQQHDWGARPLSPEHLAYLAADVRHLLDLDGILMARAAELGVDEEIAEECAHRLTAARRPPRDARPAYARVGGAASLDPAGRAILRRAMAARDGAAEVEDAPPHTIARSEALLELARRRPSSAEGLRAIGLGGARAARWADAWLAAVAQGLADGDVPEEERALFAPRVVDRAAISRRRALELRAAAWRRREARARGVDEQVVLPGHCLQDVVDLARDGALDREALARVSGLGPRRLERYGEILVALLAT